jgi:P4 family phage/plasmid primase-like protien
VPSPAPNAPAPVGPYLATAGGVVDLGRLAAAVTPSWPPTPDFFALAALPVTPDTQAAHPLWNGYLATTFTGHQELIQVLQEAFGYCLWPDCRFERFFIFYGDGDSGKSTAVETLSALLGEANISALTLDRLAGRFDLSGLVGKLANVVFDASEVGRTAEGTLKSLVSGEPVPVERKHGELSTLRLTAKHVISTNVLPRFHDRSNGIWRRVQLLPFEHVVPPDRRDPRLKEALRAELPAIAAWALAGLERLLRQGRFTRSEHADRLLAEYRRESDPVAQFLSESCAAAAAARVARRELYAAYCAWATANRQPQKGHTAFYREVRALYPQPAGEPRAGRGGDRPFVGLRLAAAQGGVAQQKAAQGVGGEGGCTGSTSSAPSFS